MERLSRPQQIHHAADNQTHGHGGEDDHASESDGPDQDGGQACRIMWLLDDLDDDGRAALRR